MNSSKFNIIRMVKSLHKAFSFVFLLLAATITAQNKLGVISEIVMASECLTKPNYNLFFESELHSSNIEKRHYWYKITFHNDCFIKLTLVPNNEADRYNISIYRTPKHESFCSEHEKLDDIEEKVTFQDTYQSDAFRQSITYTKVLEVLENDAIYILISNTSGHDAGHVLEIITCNNYSYILKVNKETTDSLFNNASVDTSENSFISRALCNTANANSKFGYITSNSEKITVNNLSRLELDSIAFENKLLVTADSTEELSAIDTDSSGTSAMPFSPGLQALFQNNQTLGNSTAPVNTKSQHLAAFEKLFGKSFKTVAPELSDNYFAFLQIPAYDSVLTKKSTTPKKEQGKRKTKKAPKPLTVSFIAVNAETKSIVKHPTLRLVKASSLNPLEYTYIDSLSLFTLEINANENYRLECDLIGFKNYSHPLDLRNVIVINDAAYFIIPMQPLKAGDKFIIPNIYFHPNLPAFREQSYTELNKLAEYMNSNQVRIVIAGHSNGNKYISNGKEQADGTPGFRGTAKKLSKKRAEAVREYLIKSGVEKNRINVKGYGGKKPLIREPKNKKEAEKNMRVEIVIIR